MELKKDFSTSFLKPAPYNPRGMHGSEHRKLGEVIDYFGLVDPIIFNTKTGVIIGGNQRYEHIKNQDKGFALILGDVGWYFTEEDLKIETEADEKALNIALNKINGFFDDELLFPLIEEISFTDTPLHSFNDEELNELLGGYDDVELGKIDPYGGKEEYKKVQHKNKTYYLKEGDEWTFGTHKLKVGQPNPEQEISIKLKGDDLRIVLSSAENIEEEELLFKTHNKEVLKTNQPNYEEE